MGRSIGCIHDFRSIKHFMNGYNWENDTGKVTVLDYAVLNRTQVYAAVEKVVKETGDRIIFALTIMFTFNSKEYSWREVLEESGPFYCSCPKRILDLLTPTTSQNSNDWRDACRARLNRNKFEMKEGLVLRKQGSNDAYVLKQKYIKQSWICNLVGSSREYRITKRWCTEHGFMPEELLFELLL